MFMRNTTNAVIATPTILLLVLSILIVRPVSAISARAIRLFVGDGGVSN